MGNQNGKDWALRILIGVCLFLAGFVVNEVKGSQKMAGQVRENTTKIETIEKTLVRLEHKLDKVLGIE